MLRMKIDIFYNNKSKKWLGCVKHNGDYLIIESAKTRDDLLNALRECEMGASQ